MTLSALLRALGAALLVVGLISGSTGYSAEGVSCGTVLGGRSSAAQGNLLLRAPCEDARSSRALIVWGAMGAGLVLGVCGFALKRREDAEKV